MVKRVLIDVVIGAALAFGSQILLYVSYLIGLAVGLSLPYESAPADPGAHPKWLTQINLMFSFSALLVLLLAFAVAWLLNIRGAAEGVRRGAVWAAVVVLWTVAVGAANGTLAMFTVSGVWAYFAAFLIGPIMAGLLHRSRTTEGRFA